MNDNYKLFEDILFSLPNPLSVRGAKTFRFVFVNDAFVKLFGKPVESVINRTPEEVFGKDLAQQMFDLDKELVETKKVLSKRLNFKQGNLNLVIEIQRIPHFSGPDSEFDFIIDIYRNISQEVAADEILRETETFFQNIFENLPLGVIIVRDNDFSVINVNPFFLNLFNLELDKILYKPIFDLEICKEKEKFKNYFSIAKEIGYLQQIEQRCTIPKCKDIDVVVHIVYVKQFNQEPWYLMIISDVSAIQQANKEIISLIQREQELQALKNRFISLISHELRTPLSGIILSVDLLQRFGEKLSPGEKEKHYERIRTSVQTITKMIENAIHLEKLTADEFLPQLRKIQIKSFLEGLARQNESQFDNKNPLVLRVPEDIEIETDEVLLGLILNNLFNNAIKYSPAGEPIYIEVTLLENDLVITIQNPGEPIPKEEIPRLFNLFYRGTNSAQTKGYGLGLSIVKKAVEALNGTIEVESSFEKGTIFTITLPSKAIT